MSWFVANLRDDLDRALQEGALVHRLEWLAVELAASGEDAAAIAVFAAVEPPGEAAGREVYLTPGCAPFLGRLLEGLASSACPPPPPERLVLLGGDPGWRQGFHERRRAS